MVDKLPVSFYPATRLRLVDTAVNATTCLAWSKGATDRAAAVTILSGQGLPIPLGSADNRLVKLLRGVRDPESVEADQVYIGPGATNLVMTTSAAPAASSREAMWWISDQGVRYGVELSDDAFTALGCPRLVAAGAVAADPGVCARPALTRADALVQHDSLAPVGAPKRCPLGLREAGC